MLACGDICASSELSSYNESFRTCLKCRMGCYYLCSTKSRERLLCARIGHHLLGKDGEHGK